MFSLIWAWINGRVNNLDAHDLRRHRAHYDVIVIIPPSEIIGKTIISGRVLGEANGIDFPTVKSFSSLKAPTFEFFHVTEITADAIGDIILIHRITRLKEATHIILEKKLFDISTLNWQKQQYIAIRGKIMR